ncbi:MAE1 [Candida oxycetoniae]|uniref:MAE1 n=1 Tax=Candida oxycetoniae TaxID=497107 RepID=A0AAI9WXX3_9ASCO|nr:MAE1 [Candida oxycetoniae]KAI3404230.1 MAE1 [Candida oxycetoniae]
MHKTATRSIARTRYFQARYQHTNAVRIAARASISTSAAAEAAAAEAAMKEIKTPIGPEAQRRQSIVKTSRLSREGAKECPLSGFSLLNSPFYNKGSAFTDEERKAFELVGLLPTGVNTLEEQVERAYFQYSTRVDDLSKNSFMDSLRLQNKVLFFALVKKHIKEMLPIIYTPTIGDAIEGYSRRFRKPEGCFLNITDPDSIEKSLANFGTDKDVDMAVITDGSAILGIGDWSIQGILIAVGKGNIITVAGGINPRRIVAIGVDAGTNNEKLLRDPLYMGNRFPRVEGKEYYDFMDKVIMAYKKRFPSSVLHFEDFSTLAAKTLLDKYRDQLACFNDDMQGTGCVIVASIKAAMKVTNRKFTESSILIYGAGAAGMGIATQIVSNLVSSGLTPEQARSKVFLMDRFGLVTESTQASPSQHEFAKPDKDWEGIDKHSLVDVVNKVKPTILIGSSTRPKAFNEEVVKTMYKYNKDPVIFPLSNPTKLHEAYPVDIMKWTDNRALIATGSPFDPVDGYVISENNNCFAFPGIVLGSVLARTTKITDEMISAAVEALSDMSPKLNDPKAGLLPDITEIHDVSAHVATAVVLQSLKEGTAQVEGEKIPDDGYVRVPTEYNACLKWVKSQMWKPEYMPLIKVEYVPEVHTNQY